MGRCRNVAIVTIKVRVHHRNSLIAGICMLGTRISDLGEISIDTTYKIFQNKQPEIMTGVSLRAGPLYITRPLARRSNLSNSEKISQLGWWMVAMQIVFVSRAKRLTVEINEQPSQLVEWKIVLEAMTSYADPLSKPDVGSSSTKTWGRATTEHAIVTRRF
jgi:hypothetical protein